MNELTKKRANRFVLVLFIFSFCLSFTSAQGLDIVNPNIPKLTAPEPEVIVQSGGGNSSFNETFTNTLYWRLDGSNAPPSSDWDMNNQDFLLNASRSGNEGGRVEWRDLSKAQPYRGSIEYLTSSFAESQTHGIYINSSSAIQLVSLLGTYVTGMLNFPDNQMIGFGTGSFVCRMQSCTLIQATIRCGLSREASYRPHKALPQALISPLPTVYVTQLAASETRGVRTTPRMTCLLTTKLSRQTCTPMRKFLR